ncbi:hypothetical protein ACWGIA_20080 [Streptomyces bobili]|uniref:hypothetical protein n=1 Tax=Streptomyces galilaeus TaxID=33899 RepID=UPI0019B7D52A|nr:hypothetical protein [Streptomyces galilaeus]GGW71336.1 hypothetical protein GCM10010350_64980 [Streptomyces galilaeus]
MSDQRVRAERGVVLAIYLEWLTGQASPDDMRKWLDRAQATRAVSSAESTLLLQELHGHLTSPDLAPQWRALGGHAVFNPDGDRIHVHTGNGEIMTALAAFAGVTVTAAVLPFLQSIAAQAGQQAFEVARATTRRMIGRKGAPQIHSGMTQIFVEETAAGLRFSVPPSLPDAALAALAATDLEALAMPAEKGRTVTIYWDEESEQWRRHVADR